MHLASHFRPAWEPQYLQGSTKRPKAMNYGACYYGDDFGGHNIPFPHPHPPKPDPYYEDCFYDMTSHIGQLYFENPYALKEAYWAKKRAGLIVAPTLKATSQKTASTQATAQICPLMSAKATLASHSQQTTQATTHKPLATHSVTQKVQFAQSVPASHGSHATAHIPSPTHQLSTHAAITGPQIAYSGPDASAVTASTIYAAPVTQTTVSSSTVASGYGTSVSHAAPLSYGATSTYSAPATTSAYTATHGIAGVAAAPITAYTSQAAYPLSTGYSVPNYGW